MLAILNVINSILDIKLVQYALLGIVILGGVYFPIKVGYLKFDNAMLKATVGDVSSALYFQNQKITELAAKTDEFKTNFEQANKRATQVAVESQKTLQKLMNVKFSGTCDDKVKQAGSVLKGELK